MKKEAGTIVIIASIATTILMVLSAYFLNSLIVEMQMSESMEKAEKAYYLAEAGINEAIWKLKNDSEWSDNFIDPDLNPDQNGNFWSASFERDNLEGGSYKVEVKNINLGEAKITARAKAPFLGKEAKRETQVTVFKPLESPTENAVIFSGGGGSNVQIANSNIEIMGGNIFSNQNLLLSGQSNINLYDDPDSEKLEGLVLAVQNINTGDNVNLDNHEAICSKNFCTEECDRCPPEEKSIPSVDFDSQSEDSFKERAMQAEKDGECSIYCNPEDGSQYQCSDQCLFSSDDFESLLWEIGSNGTLILDSEVTYVTGSVDLKGARNLEVRGALVADGSINLGMSSDWRKKGETDSGASNVEVVRDGGASGILSKRKISFGANLLSENSVIEGVIYSGDRVRMSGVPKKLTIKGGLIGRQIRLSSLWEGLEINFDNELMLYGLGYIIDGRAVEPNFSPVIKVDHWEEVY